MSVINGLFKNWSKLILLSIFLPLVIGIATAIVVPYIKTQLAIDDCLDQGGSFNHELKTCIKELPAVGSNKSFKADGVPPRP